MVRLARKCEWLGRSIVGAEFCKEPKAQRKEQTSSNNNIISIFKKWKINLKRKMGIFFLQKLLMSTSITSSGNSVRPHYARRHIDAVA